MKFKKLSLLPLLTIALGGLYPIADAHGDGHDKDKGLGHGYDQGPQLGPGDGNGYGHNKSTNAPLDGGLSLLIAAGVGVGLKKANDRRKARKPF